MTAFHFVGHEFFSLFLWTELTELNRPRNHFSISVDSVSLFPLQEVANPFCLARLSAAAFPAGDTFPFARLFPPRMIFFPAISTSFTVLVSPGSKRTAVPAGMSRRLP